jgi:hypothetical protein
MGFTGTRPPRVQVLTVATVNGSVTALGRQHPKARVWLLEDRTVVLCIPDKTAPGRVRRETYAAAVSHARWQNRSKLLTVTLLGEAGGTIVVNAKGCGCGMGAAGNAGPTAEAYDVVRVRQPEWYEADQT